MKTDIAPPAGDDNRVVFGETIDVKIADIGILDRILEPTRERIDAMANALGERGQLAPILITKDEVGWRIVAGATGWVAAHELGWTTIRATVVTGSDHELSLIEIEENLERAHLSDDERALLKAKEKELRAERLTAFETAIENTPPAPAKGGRGKKGGVRDAARKAGVPKSTAHRRAATKPSQTENGTVSEEADKAKELAVKKAERDAAMSTTKSVSKKWSRTSAAYLMTEMIAHGLKNNPTQTAQHMRETFTAESITKLIGWLDQFLTEIKKNPTAPRSRVVAETTVH